MCMITKEDMQVIERQMYNRARDIDVAIYNGIFSDLPREYVIDSLLMYQNPDGGFGGGLFIDNYNPASTVYTTYEALRILYICGFDASEKNELYTKLINKAMNYLYNRCPAIKNVWQYTTSSNDSFAHSDFFTHKSENLEECGVYPSATIYALTLILTQEKKAYYKKAMDGLKNLLERVFLKDEFSSYEVMGLSLVVEICNKLGIFEAQMKTLNEKLCKVAMNLVSSKDSWCDINMPLILLGHLNLSPELLDLVAENLDSIIDSRAPHGLWEPFHSWGTSYPEEDSAKLKWIGYISWNYLYLLNKYKKIA